MDGVCGIFSSEHSFIFFTYFLDEAYIWQTSIVYSDMVWPLGYLRVKQKRKKKTKLSFLDSVSLLS